MGLQWAWSIVWFFVLIFIAIPIAFIAAFFYIFLSPFAACCKCMIPVVEFLHKGVRLPYNVALFMVQGKSCGEI